MSELTLNITDLKGKVEKLVDLHKQLKNNYDQLMADKLAALNMIEQQKSTIESLKKNIQELTENKQEEQKRIISDTKMKINELVQEIDQCIALLK